LVNDLPSDEVLKRFKSDLLNDDGDRGAERGSAVFLGSVQDLVKGRGSDRGSTKFYSSRNIVKSQHRKRAGQKNGGGSLKRSGRSSEVDEGKLGEISNLLSGSMKHILKFDKKPDDLTQSQITSKLNLMLSQNEVKKDIFEDGEFTKKAKQSIFEKSAPGKRGSIVSRKSKTGMDSVLGGFRLGQSGP
jgi:hypothetical protein